MSRYRTPLVSRQLSGNTAGSRAAFTLVETLLALALSSVLLVAVFSLIDSTVTYHVSGNDQTLASQRLLGLLQDLRADIRAVQLDPHWRAVPEVQATLDDPMEAARSRLTSQLQLTDMEKLSEPIRLVGQSNWLVLTLAHPNPRWRHDANHAQQIAWSLGGRGSLSVPTHENLGRLINRVLPAVAQSGLVRTRLANDPVSASQSSSDRIVAADNVGFRYLSQGQWHSDWNSSNSKALPEAIEIKLQLSGDAELRTWVIATSSSTPARMP